MMSFQARRELLAQVALRYREAGGRQKSLILDEFVAATGYQRKYAIRLLRKPPPLSLAIRRPRARRYGQPVQDALKIAWAAANFICAKRLVPFLPELVPALERHGHLQLDGEVREQLLNMSSSTAERLLAAIRQQEQPHGRSTTKSGVLLKRQIPIRTFNDWNETQPGFFEGDLVAHCGWNVEGEFLYTFVLTDVATGWTECLALLHRSQAAVVQALDRARQLLPFPMLGFDSDNGSEFINAELLAYCEREQLTFTRGRVAKKNDQCFVEQKNGAIVRQYVGYDRFEGERAYRQLVELYRALRLYINFFQPSMKLLSKQRDGSKVQRKYEPAQTPLQRLLAAHVLTAEAEARLQAVYRSLDPVRLLQQIVVLQDALWHLAVVPASAAATPDQTPPTTPETRFNRAACGLGLETKDGEGAAATCTTGTPASDSEHKARRYHRTKQPPAPHTWRTRPDPFESVWAEVCRWLAADPGHTAQSVLNELQQRYPEQFPDSQLRTMQRRVREWRAQSILTFDDQWLHEQSLAEEQLPHPLQAIVER
jgi:hypothetical protein